MEFPDNCDDHEDETDGHVRELPKYQTYQFIWNEIPITVRHCPNWMGRINGVPTHHIEFYSEGRQPLPISETGYRSHFMIGTEALADFDHDVARFAQAMLDAAALNREWQKFEEASRQGELF